VEIGFFFKLPGFRTGKDNQRTVWKLPPQLLDVPQSLHLGQFRIHQAEVNHPVVKEGGGFGEVRAMDDVIMLRINGPPHRFREIGVLSQHQ